MSKGFLKALRRLPKTYSPEYKSRFYKLIDKFGTHYITKVKQSPGNGRVSLSRCAPWLNGLCLQVRLGGSIQSVTSIRTCQASLQGLSVEEVQMCLEAEASATIKATIKTEMKHCKKNTDKQEFKTSFSSLFNDRCAPLGGSCSPTTTALFS